MSLYLHSGPIFSKWLLKPKKVCWTPHHTYQLMTAFESDFSTTGGFIFMLLARFLGINNHNRINVPSQRPQWSLFFLSFIQIFITGSAVRADLFYWDGLFLNISHLFSKIPINLGYF